MFALILIYFAIIAPGFVSTFNTVYSAERSTILGVLAFRNGGRDHWRRL
jgi:ribose transport system permease protein